MNDPSINPHGSPGKAVSVLVVDDDRDLCWSISRILQSENFRCLEAFDGESALQIASAKPLDLMVLDMMMPGLSGEVVLERLCETQNPVSVIVLTAHASIDAAVRAMKLGAVDYLTKPLRADELLLSIQKVLGFRSIQNRVVKLESQLQSVTPKTELVGLSQAIQQARETAQKVAPSDITVLLLGESGTGKDLLARMIHQCSPRRAQPFVVVDCGSLSETLLESEVFGHEKGAFTGAEARRIGKVESADGGTLFLDEVGDLSSAGQQRFLRIIEARSVERLGGRDSIEVDVRVIAATHKDLQKEMEQGRFRQDLFYRLSVFPIRLTPLRDRPEDVEPLALYFLARFNSEMRKKVHEISPLAHSLLKAYPWPGNVRELRNVMERAVLLADSVVNPEHLPREIVSSDGAPGEGMESQRDLKRVRRSAADQAEVRLLKQILVEAGWNRAEAARRLRINYKTLLEKLSQWRLEKPTT